MREIKFRYIVKHVESKNIEVKIYSLSQLEERPLTSLSPVFIQGYELLGKSQYTGLKDKNGVEVYEGDIGWDEHQETHGLVEFEEGKFIYSTESVCEDLWEISDSIEVVGNIYEKPELMEVQS